MPALSSSPIHPVLGHLADLAGDAAGDSPGLLAVLATAADPRHRRGVRHRLAVILGLAVCAVLAGARSFTAIAEWAADADEQALARLKVRRVVPPESTFRRTLQRLDADAFDDLAGAWAARCTAPRPGGRRVAAVDGKTLPGSGHGQENSRHLLAASGHAHGAVLGQVEAGAKTSEIPLFTALLDRIEITDAVITADALHAQRGHATYLARRGAHYLLIVKRNQPSLHAQLAALPRRDVPKAYDKAGHGHRRTGRRTLKVTSVTAGLAFPHAAQAIQITRRRKVKGKWSRETCYAVTSLTLTQATYAQLAAIIRGHWGIEDQLHWMRDMDFGRRPLPGPHRQRTPHHGQPPQPGHHHPAANRRSQHRRRPALPSPAAQPPPPDDHQLLTDFAEALRSTLTH
jgi:predicted transposase YbfD/YdcC